MYMPAYMYLDHILHTYIWKECTFCVASVIKNTLYISVCYLASKINTIIKSFVILQHSCTPYSTWCMGSLLSRVGS